MSAVLEEKRRALILNPQRMGLAEQKRQDWVVDAEEGTLIEDVLEQGYWSHMAMHLQKFDHIEVRLETGEWIANVIVTGTGRNWASVHLVSKIELTLAAEDTLSDKHTINYGGPHHQWRVVRNSDKEVIQKDFKDKASAETWLRQYEGNVLKAV